MEICYVNLAYAVRDLAYVKHFMTIYSPTNISLAHKLTLTVKWTIGLQCGTAGPRRPIYAGLSGIDLPLLVHA